MTEYVLPVLIICAALVATLWGIAGIKEFRENQKAKREWLKTNQAAELGAAYRAVAEARTMIIEAHSDVLEQRVKSLLGA
jgi:flagellar basal body-associated protein FliL